MSKGGFRGLFLVKFDLILLCERANVRACMVLIFEFLVKVLVGELQREGPGPLSDPTALG